MRGVSPNGLSTPMPRFNMADAWKVIAALSKDAQPDKFGS